MVQRSGLPCILSFERTSRFARFTYIYDIDQTRVPIREMFGMTVGVSKRKVFAAPCALLKKELPFEAVLRSADIVAPNTVPKRVLRALDLDKHRRTGVDLFVFS